MSAAGEKVELRAAPMPTFADLFDVALKGADVAMPVLVTMLKTADLKGGLMVADEIWGSVKTAHKVWQEQRSTIVEACNSHAQLLTQRDALLSEIAGMKRREEAALNIATDRTEEHIRFQKQRDALEAREKVLTESLHMIANEVYWRDGEVLKRIHAIALRALATGAPKP